MSEAIPLPVIAGYIIPPTQIELRKRIDKAKDWVDRVYREGDTYAMVGEYPSLPLNIVVHRPQGQGDDDWSPRFLGHYSHFDAVFGQAGFSSRTTFAVICDASERIGTYDTDEFDVSFDGRQHSSINPDWDKLLEWKMDFSGFKQPTLHVKREFLFNFQQRITITFKEFQTSDDVDNVDLYFGDHLIASGIDENTQVNTQWQFNCGAGGLGFGDNYGVGSGRYTVRHGCQMAMNIYDAWSETPKANKIGAFVQSEGYTQDVYDPLFGLSTGEADDYFQEGDSWHDCDKGHGYATGHHRIGHDPYGYVYESKIHFFELMGTLLSSERFWIEYCVYDPYIKCLQALHILNKYNDADRSYQHGRFPWSTTTPRKAAEDICRRMVSDRGIGVFGAVFTIDIPWISIPWVEGDHSVPMFSKERWAASGVRTAALAALCATLGYGPTDDDRFKPWADLMIRNLCSAQWGVYTNHANAVHIGLDHKGLNEGATFGGQRLGKETRLRADHTGGLMVCWASSGQFHEFDNPWKIFSIWPTNCGGSLKPRRGEAGGDHNSGWSSLPRYILAHFNEYTGLSGAGTCAETIDYIDLDGSVQHEWGAWVKGEYAAGLRMALKVYNDSYTLLETHYINLAQDYNDWTKVYTTDMMHGQAWWGKIVIEQSQLGRPWMRFDGAYVKLTSNGEYRFGGDFDVRTKYRYATTKGGGGIPYVEDILQPDPFNQPIEIPVFLPTNMEGTGAFIQALRIYNYHKYNDAYPSGVNLPTN